MRPLFVSLLILTLSAASARADYRSRERALRQALLDCPEADVACRVACWNSMMTLHMEHGEIDPAIKAMQAAEKLPWSTLPEDHPERVNLEINRGAIAFTRGDKKLAARYYERASKFTTGSQATLYSNWALAVLAEGRIREGIELLERSRAMAEHPVVLGNLAIAYASVQSPLAQAMFERAIELSERLHTRAHPTTARLILNYGTYLENTGRKRDGRKLQDEGKTFLRGFVQSEQLGLTIRARP